jgi:hypothetical protein
MPFGNFVRVGSLAAAASSSQGLPGTTGHPPIPDKHCRTNEIVIIAFGPSLSNVFSARDIIALGRVETTE